MSSRSINKVILIGNLTRDPELKYTPNGTAVCTFGVATNRSWTTQTGETKEDVQFHRIVAWQKLAELASKLLIKGRKIYLEGRIVYRNYTAKDGQQKSITEIILDDFVIFDSKRASEMTSAQDTPKDLASQDEFSDATNTPVSSESFADLESQKNSKETSSEKTQSKSESIDPEDIDIPF